MGHYPPAGKTFDPRIPVCAGVYNVRIYLHRCGPEVTALFRYFDGYVLDVDKYYRNTGNYPIIQYTAESRCRVEFLRMLAWNLITLPASDYEWFRQECRSMLPSWIALRRRNDIEVDEMLDVPDVDAYLDQDQWIWVRDALEGN